MKIVFSNKKGSIEKCSNNIYYVYDYRGIFKGWFKVFEEAKEKLNEVIM